MLRRRSLRGTLPRMSFPATEQASLRPAKESAGDPAPVPPVARLGPRRRSLAIAGTTLLLLLPALANGFPFVFSDTGSYLAAGYTASAPLDGTLLYGGFLRISLWSGTLWLAATAQSLLIAWLLWETIALFGRAKRPWVTALASGAILACFSPVPYFTGLLLPDVFLPIGLLAGGVWLASGPLSTPKRIGLLALIYVGAAATFAGLLSSTAALALASATEAGRTRRLRLTARWTLAWAAIASAWLSVPLLNRWGGPPLTYSRGAKPMLVARMAELGTLSAFLADVCPTQSLGLCHPRHPIPQNATEFLWQPTSPFYDLGGWRDLREISRTLGMFARRPAEWPRYLGAAVGGALVSFAHLGVPRIFEPVGRGSAVWSQLARHDPSELNRYLSAHQQEVGWYRFVGRDVFFEVLTALSLLALGFARLRSGRDRRLAARPRTLAFTVGAGAVIAAVVSSMFGMPDGRRGLGAMFLFPLLALSGPLEPDRLVRAVRVRLSRLHWRLSSANSPLAGSSAAVLRALWPSPPWRSPTLWVTVSLFAKLLLTHATLGLDLGQRWPLDWFAHAVSGLLHGSAVPAFDALYLVSAGTAVALTACPLLLRNRWKLVSLFAVDLVVSLLAFSDAVYCRYFHDFLSIPVLLQAKQVGELGSCIGALLRPSDLLFGIDLLGWVLWAVVAKPRQTPTTGASLRVRVGRVGAALGLAVLLVVPPVATGLVQNEGLTTNTWSRTALYGIVGLVGLHAVTSIQFAAEHLLIDPLSPKRRAEIAERFAQRAHTRGAHSPLWGNATGQNLIVVQLEAFQNFVIGRSVGGVEITPNLNRLMPELAYFPNYFHQTAQGRTSDAEFASNCSLHHLDYGSAYVRFPDDHYVCLPQVLKDAGYSTAVFHGNEGAFYNRYYIYPRIGFERFFDVSDFDLQQRVGWALGDEPFFTQTAEKLRTLPRPFYAFLITLSSHYPFDLPSSLRTLPPGPLQPGLLFDYLESVHYLDQALGEFVEALQRDGLWDRSVVIFYGDHDDGISDADENYAAVYGHSLTSFETAQLAYQVGMFIHLPQNALAGRYEQPRGQTDLAPTSLSALGLESTTLPWLGQDVFSTHHTRVTMREGSFVTDDRMYFAPSNQCFDRERGEPIPVSACTDQRKRALDELDDSRAVVTHDLQRDLLAPSTARLPQ